VVDGLIIAAPASGSGKTVVTLGLLRHLARSGVHVASAKVGPDYIDPAFHAAASGKPCLNLDPWAMRPATRRAIVSHLAEDARLVVCEGVMGLFDGATHDVGSTADVARWSGWPVILVVDVRAQAASAAAVVRGFATHRAGVHMGGVVFNRVGSTRHADVLRSALAEALPDLPILGMLPRDEALAVPERHLGLVQATEHTDLDAFLDRAADAIAAHVDTATLMTLARPALDGIAAGNDGADALAPLPPLGQRIAVADDAAFAFAYPAVLAGWRNRGADIMPFSPLADEAPDAGADALYLPGGYPELHAGRLAAAGCFLDGVRKAAQRGAVMLGECGGYMVLGDGLIDADGARHAMAGLLQLETSFSRPRLHLGYRDAALVADGPLGRAGGRFRGHEFHYARVEREGPGEALFRCHDASGQSLGTTGLRRGAVLGSFVHLIDAAG
jgi:cobyrinic acid a,c-diamide synthase